MNTENISEELLIFHCSPTMAGLKTGNLFNCPVKNNRTFLENIREMNRRLLPRGVRIVPLKNMGQSVLVYMCRLKDGEAFQHEIGLFLGIRCLFTQNNTYRERMDAKPGGYRPV